MNLFLDKAEEHFDRGKESSASNALKSAKRLDGKKHDEAEDAMGDLRDSMRRGHGHDDDD